MGFLDFLPLVGDVASGIFGFGSQAKTNADQMKLAEYQYSKNLEMWNRNNEYNTPSAQRERMEAAGFNPNLVYGHGSVVNTSSSAPQYSAPTLQAYTQFGNFGQDMLDGILSVRKNIAEVKKIEAEATRAQNLARKDAVDADNAEQFGYDAAKADLDDKIFTAQLKQYKSQLESARAFYADELAYSENLKNQVDVDLIIAKKNHIEKQIENLDSLIELNKSSKDLNIAKTGLTKAQTATEKEKPALVRNQTLYNQALTLLTKAKVGGAYADSVSSMARASVYDELIASEIVKNEYTLRKLALECIHIANSNHMDEERANKLYFDRVSSQIDAAFAQDLKELGILGGLLNIFKQM